MQIDFFICIDHISVLRKNRCRRSTGLMISVGICSRPVPFKIVTVMFDHCRTFAMGFYFFKQFFNIGGLAGIFDTADA